MVIDTFYSLRAIGKTGGGNPDENNSHHQIFSLPAALREPSATVFNEK